MTLTKQKGLLTQKEIAKLHHDFENNPAYRAALNAVTQTSIENIAMNRSVINSADFTFSHLLDQWTVTHQKATGRCWIFAGLNLLRVGAMKKLNLANFEFSQNYTFFWDKLERSNLFLEHIIETAKEPLEDRVVDFLMSNVLSDGGQWQMFVNLIEKYGVVPQAVMPETESSSNSRLMNSVLVAKLHEGAKLLRDLHSKHASKEKLRAAKDDILKIIYRILAIHLGVPPTKFFWQWHDKKNTFHRDGEITPHQFAKKYITIPYEEYVCLVNDPRTTSPFNRTFTVKYLGNIVEGQMVKYLNVEIDVLKKITMHTIMKGEPVWMGCDVGKMIRKDLGIFDKNLYDYESLYNAKFEMTKADRLNYHQAAMTHAMLFTGVDVVNGSPRRWRIENSWGEDKVGRKGFFIMNDNWFDEHVFEIAVNKKALPKKLQDALKLPPIILPPWDPMGSLAK
jgi:bleomycin hydrolase